ncbi:3'-5' exoribonuclease domain-containing protein [Flindersiella endophytica]
MERPNVYFSVDVEADGPIPGPYSMSSFGMAVAGVFADGGFTPADPARETFYAELRPISDTFDPRAASVSGLDRASLLRDGRDPHEAMNACARWVVEVAAGRYPVFAAYPLGFDWMWMYWYFLRFADAGSPFDYSRAFDMKTMYALKAGLPISQAGLTKLPDFLRSTRTHTHNALDDAIEQADILANLFVWSGGS